MRLLTFFLLALTPLLAADDRAAILGTWTLDPGSSQFRGSEPPTGGTLTISKTHKTIHFAKRLTLAQGERTEEADWRVDDRYHPDTTTGAGEVLAKWSGSTLTGEREKDQSHDSVRLTVSSGGQVLTESVHHTGAGESYDSTLVWRKR